MAGIDWLSLATTERAKYAGLTTNAQRFRWWAKQLLDAEYKRGKENILQTDCSGTICYPLYGMGYDIRIKASELCETIFQTTPVVFSMENTLAMFFRNPQGEIIHVAPFMGPDVLMNAGDPVSFRTTQYLTSWFRRHEKAEAVCRQLDWEAAAELSESGRNCWGLDPTVKTLRR